MKSSICCYRRWQPDLGQKSCHCWALLTDCSFHQQTNCLSWRLWVRSIQVISTSARWRSTVSSVMFWNLFRTVKSTRAVFSLCNSTWWILECWRCIHILRWLTSWYSPCRLFVLMWTVLFRFEVCDELTAQHHEFGHGWVISWSLQCKAGSWAKMGWTLSATTSGTVDSVNDWCELEVWLSWFLLFFSLTNLLQVWRFRSNRALSNFLLAWRICTECSYSQTENIFWLLYTVVLILFLLTIINSDSANR